MTSKAQPTILLIPGAFTTPIGSKKTCYDILLPYLHTLGYATVVASMPGCNPSDPSSCTAEKDGAYVVDEYLEPLVKEGKEVIVFAHSSGATFFGGKRVGGMLKVNGGENGGVLGIIYISGALTPDGITQADYMGGQLPPFCKVDSPSPGLFHFDPIIPHLYADVHPSLHDELIAAHVPYAMTSLGTPVCQPLWANRELNGRRVYIITTLDATFPEPVQRWFVEGSGVEWDVKEVKGGHAAFISQPEAVATVIAEAVGKWAY